MILTKHAHARFKQRQKIKNHAEMRRRFALAMERGILLPEGTNKHGTLCYVFDGFKYIVSSNGEYLITVISEKAPSPVSKRHLIEEQKSKQYVAEVRQFLCAV